MLTAEQQKQRETRPKGFVPGAFPLPGELMASSLQDRLKLTTDQKRQLAELQKEADGKLAAILRTTRNNGSRCRTWRGDLQAAVPAVFRRTAGRISGFRRRL